MENILYDYKLDGCTLLCIYRNMYCIFNADKVSYKRWITSEPKNFSIPFHAYVIREPGQCYFPLDPTSLKAPTQLRASLESTFPQQIASTVFSLYSAFKYNLHNRQKL